MTREQAKLILPIVQAFAEGKTIQYDVWHEGGKADWVTVTELTYTSQTHPERYRIKPEKKYRPFASKEECWNEMQKHQPIGWLRSKYDGGYFLIDSVEDKGGRHGSSSFTFNEPFEQCTFPDGAPFGIEAKEENNGEV